MRKPKKPKTLAGFAPQHSVIVRTFELDRARTARLMATLLQFEPSTVRFSMLKGVGWVFSLPWCEDMALFQSWLKDQKMPDGSAVFEWMEVQS